MRFEHLVAAASSLLMTLDFSAALASGGGSVGGPSGGSVSTPRTPEQLAVLAYHEGEHYVAKAKDYESDAAKSSTDDKRAKALEKARKAYASALDQFKQAVAKRDDLFQGWNYIGFTERHLGDYESALAAYSRALELNPGYAEAVEYRAEAYLGLNRIEDAKSDYMKLFRDVRPLAAELMAAMHRWLEERQHDAKGVSSEELAAFSQWVDDRSAVAAQTASLATGPSATPMADWK